MSDIMSSNLLHCCIETCLNFDKQYPELLSGPGNFIRCIHCTEIYIVKSKPGVWEYMPAWVRPKKNQALNQKDWEEAQKKWHQKLVNEV